MAGKGGPTAVKGGSYDDPLATGLFMPLANKLVKHCHCSVSSKLVLMVLKEDIIFEANTPQAIMQATVAPSGALALDIRRITTAGVDTSIGTVNFASGAKSGSVTMSTVTIPTADTIYIESPADVLGIEDLFIDLVGKSILPVY